jgi:phosphatidylglycerol:prolipoprotein diacylglycerol transferase
LGWPYYREHPWEIINFWNGGFRGLGIYGGLVGGILAVLIYCWRNRLQPLRYLDFIAPNVLIAQAIGRIGNFANQELYGPPTTLAWAFHINPRYPCQLPRDLPQSIQLCGTPTLTEETLTWYATHGYHPTFFYEAGWNLLMFLLLAWVIWQFGRRLRTGDGVWLYLIAYPLGRFWVELFRPDAWVWGQLATAQWIAIGAILVGLLALIGRHRNWSWREHPADSLIALSRHRQPPLADQSTISMK